MKISLFKTIILISTILLLSSCMISRFETTSLNPPTTGSDLSFKVGDGTVSSLDVNEGSTLVFVVSLNKAQPKDVTLKIEASGSSLSSVFSQSFPITKVFPAGQTSASISLITIHDPLYSGPRIFNVVLSDSGNTAQTSFALTVNDLESTPTLSFASPAQSVSEAAGTGSIGVTMSGASSIEITVAYTFADGNGLNGNHYTGVNGSLVFAPGETSKSINFNINDNGTYGGDVNFSVSLATGGSHTVTVLDDELPMGLFNITGITSTGDSLLDAYLSNATSPIVNWESSTNATSYDVTIYQNDGSTVQCATQNTTSTSLDLGGGCSLTAGQFYRAKVSAKLGTMSQDASNNLFSFYVNQSPSLGSGGNGAWYVMAGSSLSINALWAASPAVGIATDPEGDSLTFTSVGSATLGTADISVNTTLVYTATGTSHGKETLSYTIADSKGGALSGNVIIHVVKPFTWSGAISSLWSTPGNWCGTSVSTDSRSCNSASAAPGASDIIHFNDTCQSTSTCTPTTTANLNVAGVNIVSNGFNQGTGFTLTIGTSGWTQSGGTFTGSNAAMTLTGAYSLSGGSFTSTSNTLRVKNWSITGGNFIHNSGTLIFEPTSYTTAVVVAGGSASYFNVTFGGSAANNSLSDAMNIYGTLTLNDAHMYPGTISGGSINAYGNVTASTYGKKGSTIINIVGSTDQTLTGTANANWPNLTINKTGGTAFLTGTILIHGNYTYTAGTLDAITNSSTLLLVPAGMGTSTIIAGAGVDYFNVTFGGSRTSYNLNDTMNVVGTLTLADTDVYPGGINGGALHAYGNVTASNYGKKGSTIVNIVGNTDQILSGSANANWPNLTINKTVGTAFFSGTIRINRSYTYSAGTLDAITNSSTLLFFPEGMSTTAINPGASVNYFNVTFGSSRANFTLNSAMNVVGTLSLADTDSLSGSINGGELHAYGNVSASNYGKKGSTIVNIVGNTDQILSGSANANWPNLTINKTVGTAFFSGTIRISRSYTYSAGTLDAITNSSTLLFFPEGMSTTTINPGASVNYFNVTFGSSRANFTLNSAMNVVGTLSLADTDGLSGSINGGPLYAYGNVSASSYGKKGSVNITMLGATPATISQANANSYVPLNFNIEKTGPMTLATNVSLSQANQNLNILSGNMDMAGLNLTIAGSLSLNGTTLTKNGGTLTVGGVSQGDGALFGGSVAP